MFNKYNTKEPSKVVIARVGIASDLVLWYALTCTFIPPHMYHTKSSSKDENKSNSSHSIPFWRGNINV